MHGRMDQSDQAARRKKEGERPLLLVVEDLENHRQLLEIYFRNQPFDVVFAKDGAEALRLVKEKEFDAVLLDCAMPDMDGFEVARRIRHWETESFAPYPMRLGFMTANVRLVELTSLLEEVRATIFLRKPEDLNLQLGERIAAWMGLVRKGEE